MFKLFTEFTKKNFGFMNESETFLFMDYISKYFGFDPS
jgi:hypothetical protein